MPPYYFSADLRNYPSVLDGSIVKKYVNFDYPPLGIKYINNKPYSEKDTIKIGQNIDVDDIPVSVDVKFGFTKKSVNMRMTPFDAILHKGNPNFDLNQYTRIGASAPIALLHTSLDGKFYYVQTKFMRGWIPSDSVFFFNKENFENILDLPFLRVVADNLKISGIKYSIGDKIPLVSKNIFGYQIILPDGGKKFIFKTSKVHYENEIYSYDKMEKIADTLIGNPYDWGGKNGYRDCSAFVRDLWLVFGINLPRSTLLQSETGKEIIGKPKSKKEFYDVLKKAKPFKTLIFFKGHVLMFGGMKNNDFIVYHAVNRLKKDSGETVYFSSVLKQFLFKDHYSDIWERVVKVIEIDQSIHPFTLITDQ